MGIFTPECRYFAEPDPAVLRDWLLRLRLRAYALGSNYKVAYLLGMRCAGGGVLYFGGVNVECLDHRQTVHSEECAIGFIVTAMGKRATIHEGWGMGAPGALTGRCDHPMADLAGQPCGNCRQQIMGLAESDDVQIHSLSLNGHDNVKTINYLLPDAFQFEDYDDGAATERKAARGALAPIDPTDILARVIRPGDLSEAQIFAWLDSLESIDYASHIGQSVVLRLDNGFYVAGVKVENAAYTGINAMQAALGNATVNFGKVSVDAIYALSKPRRVDMAGDDLVYPLSLPSLQGLNEFIAAPDVPVRLFTTAGQSVTMPYDRAAAVFSSFTRQTYHISGGVLRAV